MVIITEHPAPHPGAPGCSHGEHRGPQPTGLPRPTRPSAGKRRSRCRAAAVGGVKTTGPCPQDSSPRSQLVHAQSWFPAGHAASGTRCLPPNRPHAQQGQRRPALPAKPAWKITKVAPGIGSRECALRRHRASLVQALGPPAPFWRLTGCHGAPQQDQKVGLIGAAVAAPI